MAGIIPFDAVQATASAALYPQTKEFGMSFADRACLALGIHRNAEVLTTEQKMGLLQILVKVLLIRGRHRSALARRAKRPTLTFIRTSGRQARCWPLMPDSIS
jgi:hypothetical protein